MKNKVIFSKMNKKENIEIIKWAFFEDNDSLDIHKYTINYFPELKSINKNSTSKEEIYKLIENIVSSNYDKCSDKIDSEVERYNMIWSKYNDDYFDLLCKYFEIEWPNDKTIINASIGLIPVFPRYLENFSFALSINVDENTVIKSTAHEVLHFAWFEKWKQLYPDCQTREFNAPYSPWKYSEMIVDPILNSYDFQNIFKGTFIEKTYDSFYELYYDNERVMDNLKKIYNEEKSINNKIINGYNYVKRVMESREK